MLSQERRQSQEQRTREAPRKQEAKQEKVKLTSQQLAEFERKRFEREQQGKFTLIFPFSSRSEQLAIELNKQSGSSGNQMVMNGPNHMKQLVNEIKVYYDERMAFLKKKPS